MFHAVARQLERIFCIKCKWNEAAAWVNFIIFMSGNLHGSGQLSLLFSKVNFIAELLNTPPSLIRP